MTTGRTAVWCLGLAAGVLGGWPGLPSPTAACAGENGVVLKITGNGKYERGTPVGATLRVSNTAQNDLEIRVPLPINPWNWFVKHRAKCGLTMVTPGGEERALLPLVAPEGDPAYSAEPERLGHGESMDIDINLRNLFWFPIKEVGDYKLAINWDGALAEYKFTIVEHEGLMLEAAIDWEAPPQRVGGAPPREPMEHRCEYAIPSKKTKAGAYSILCREGGVFIPVMDLRRKPVAIRAVKLLDNWVAPEKAFLMWLDEDSTIWCVPPYLLRRLPLDTGKCRSFKAPGAASFGEVELVRDEERELWDLKVAMKETVPGRAERNVYIRLWRFDVLLIDRERFEESKARAAKYRPSKPPAPSQAEMAPKPSIQHSHSGIRHSGIRHSRHSGAFGHSGDTYRYWSPPKPGGSEAPEEPAVIRQVEA